MVLNARRAARGVLTSGEILKVVHHEDDYEWLNGQIGHYHSYEEGCAFVLGFYHAIDIAFDGQQEVES